MPFAAEQISEEKLRAGCFGWQTFWYTCWTQSCFDFTTSVQFGEHGVPWRQHWQRQKKSVTPFLLKSGAEEQVLRRKSSWKLWSRRKIIMEYRDLRTEINGENLECCHWWRWKLLMASILNNHQNNCNISRITSAWYSPPNIKQLRQHIGTKQILPSGGQNSPAAFPQLPLLGGSKAAFINPTS